MEEWEQFDGTPSDVPLGPGETKVFFGEYSKKEDRPGPDGGVAIIVRTANHEGTAHTQFYDLTGARLFVQMLTDAIEGAYQHNLDQWSLSVKEGDDE